MPRYHWLNSICSKCASTWYANLHHMFENIPTKPPKEPSRISTPDNHTTIHQIVTR
ncbi:hypothetical protein DPMN_153334 [Dreissena polymorpha]|uniref:Uncharacterized protein n=1 Tax=Dreissena polymorpha TaxID=45954 RepID=A0A9D4FK00_DREPO|nr:hypothetical protein DPMN_153334 [Dreissena polymorpha]